MKLEEIAKEGLKRGKQLMSASRDTEKTLDIEVLHKGLMTTGILKSYLPKQFMVDWSALRTELTERVTVLNSDPLIRIIDLPCIRI